VNERPATVQGLGLIALEPYRSLQTGEELAARKGRQLDNLCATVAELEAEAEALRS
jgi:hypothetical protein